MTPLKVTGYCMIVGGCLLFLGNAIFSPMLPIEEQASTIVGSAAFVWRLAINALTVFLLMTGSIGLYSCHRGKRGLFHALAFGTAFVGSACMFAHEWGQAFYMHAMAVANPVAFDALDGASPTPLLIELGLALGGFSLGWIAFSIAMLRAKVLPRRGPVLVLSGFVAVPVLSAALASPIWGGVFGSVILGGGMALLGIDLLKGSTDPMAS